MSEECPSRCQRQPLVVDDRPRHRVRRRHNDTLYTHRRASFRASNICSILETIRPSSVTNKTLVTVLQRTCHPRRSKPSSVTSVTALSELRRTYDRACLTPSSADGQLSHGRLLVVRPTSPHRRGPHPSLDPSRNTITIIDDATPHNGPARFWFLRAIWPYRAATGHAAIASGSEDPVLAVAEETQ